MVRLAGNDAMLLTSFMWIFDEIEDQATTDHVETVGLVVGQRSLKEVLLEDVRVLRVKIDGMVLDPL
jgi:hypothetical protein